MKYYVLETTMHRDAYKAITFREALAGHMKFVKQQFEEGRVLFSGTKPGNSGGVRVLRISDEEQVESFWKHDPMYEAGLLEYCVTAFHPLDVTDSVRHWFDQ